MQTKQWWLEGSWTVCQIFFEENVVTSNLLQQASIYDNVYQKMYIHLLYFMVVSDPCQYRVIGKKNIYPSFTGSPIFHQISRHGNLERSVGSSGISSTVASAVGWGSSLGAPNFKGTKIIIWTNHQCSANSYTIVGDFQALFLKNMRKSNWMLSPKFRCRNTEICFEVSPPSWILWMTKHSFWSNFLRQI